MKGPSKRLSNAEYLALSDQKAEDWRSISGVNPTMFGAAGALLAVGVSEHEAIIVALSPLPLFLSVWHMVRHARLQLQMITYLVVFAPEATSSWERDLATVRPRYWTQYRQPRVSPSFPFVNHLGSAVAWVKAPAAWNTWLLISMAVAAPVELLPILGDGYSDTLLAVTIGVISVAVAAVLTIRSSSRIESERHQWTSLWTEYRDEPKG